MIYSAFIERPSSHIVDWLDLQQQAKHPRLGIATYFYVLLKQASASVNIRKTEENIEALV